MTGTSCSISDRSSLGPLVGVKLLGVRRNIISRADLNVDGELWSLLRCLSFWKFVVQGIGLPSAFPDGRSRMGVLGFNNIGSSLLVASINHTGTVRAIPVCDFSDIGDSWAETGEQVPLSQPSCLLTDTTPLLCTSLGKG